MSRTYKDIGINLKSMPLGEADRLLTILTREHGLVRAVAYGARKPKSKLGGRSSLLVVNQLLLAQGRSLDKIAQAETMISYPGLSQNLAKLTISQYWGELALAQALSEQPQTQLFEGFCQLLAQLEQAASDHILPLFLIGILQLLHWAGITPQVYACCITQAPLAPAHHPPDWQVGFSPNAGGTVSLTAWDQLSMSVNGAPSAQGIATDRPGHRYQSRHQPPRRSPQRTKLSAVDLHLLQVLHQVVHPPEPPLADAGAPVAPVLAVPNESQYPLAAWMALERALRHYAQYHFEQPIRSAALVHTCFTPPS